MKSILAILLFLVVMIDFAGCSRSKLPLHTIDPLPPSRDTFISIYPSPTIGVAPFGVEYSIHISMLDSDDVKEKPIIKVEVDFGEGFVDVTSSGDFRYKPPIFRGNYTYENPGEFIVRLRVTYWDDGVIERTMLDRVTVIPADDVGGDGA